jgi:cytochrome P450
MSVVFFGIAPDSECFREFQRLEQIVRNNHRHLMKRHRVRPALEQLAALLVRHDTSTRNDIAGPRSFLSEILRLEHDARDNDFLFYNLVFMFEIGVGDLTGLATWVLQMLCDHPQWGERVREEATEQTGARGMTATRIIMETLRLEQSEFILRRTIRPIQFNGYTVPRGWQVRVCVHESHRNGNVFEEPNEFNPARFRKRPFTRDEYAPSGMNNKSCLGEHLTLTFGRIFVQELACGYGWRAIKNGPPEAGAYHWRPSSLLGVDIKRIARTDVPAKE